MAESYRETSCWTKHWKKVLIASIVAVLLIVIVTLCCVLIPRKSDEEKSRHNHIQKSHTISPLIGNGPTGEPISIAGPKPPSKPTPITKPTLTTKPTSIRKPTLITTPTSPAKPTPVSSETCKQFVASELDAFKTNHTKDAKECKDDLITVANDFKNTNVNEAECTPEDLKPMQYICDALKKDESSDTKTCEQFVASELDAFKTKHTKDAQECKDDLITVANDFKKTNVNEEECTPEDLKPMQYICDALKKDISSDTKTCKQVVASNLDSFKKEHTEDEQKCKDDLVDFKGLFGIGKECTTDDLKPMQDICDALINDESSDTKSFPEKFIFRHFGNIATHFTDFKKCATSYTFGDSHELEEFCGLPFEQEFNKSSRFDVRPRYLPASYATNKPDTRVLFSLKGVSTNFVGAIYDPNTTLVIEGSGKDLRSHTMVSDRNHDSMTPYDINKNRSRPDFNRWYKNSVRTYHENFDNRGSGKNDVRVNEKFCEIYKNDDVKICKETQLSQQDLLDYVETQSGKSKINNEVVISPTPKDLKGFFFNGENDFKRDEAKNAACKMRSLFLEEYKRAKNVGVWECQTVTDWSDGFTTQLSTCNAVAC